MENRILIRSSLSRWPAYLTGFLSLIALVVGVILCILPKTLVLGMILGVVGVVGLLIAIYVEANRIKQLMWLTLESGRFTVIDNIGERTFNDDDIVSMALKHKDNFSNGNHTSTTRTFRVWIVSQQDQPELIEMKNTIKLGEADAMLPFVERIVKLLKDRADADRLKNLSILGEGWELTAKSLVLRHPITGESETSLDDIAAIMCIDDKLKIWKRGEDAAFASLPLDAANAHLLNVLLEEELAKHPDEAKQQPAGQLGRIIFERKPHRSLVILLGVLAGLLFVIGCVTLAILLTGANRRHDQEGLIIGTSILWIIAVVIGILTWVTIKSLFRCHQFGVYQRGLFGEKTLLYSEVEAFSYSATKHYHNGSYIGTNLKLSFLPRKELNKPKLVYSTTVKNVDHSLEEMRDEIAGMIGSRIYSQVQAGQAVTWTDSMTLEPTGIRYRPSSLFGKQPEQTMTYPQISGHNIQQGNFSLFQRGKPKPVTTVSTTARNFFPGYFAFQALLAQASQTPSLPATESLKQTDEV